MNRFLTIIALMILSMSCSVKNKSSIRTPNSVAAGKIDLLEIPRRIQDDINKAQINFNNCTNKLSQIEREYTQAQQVQFDKGQIEIDGGIILEEMFQTRIKIHSLLSNFPLDCRKKIKNIFLSMRMVEDMVGIYYYKVPQISADHLNYQEEKTPIYEREAYFPYHLNSNVDASKKFEFKNGDIMITKGISFVSSTISEIAKPSSVFSHIVFIHVDQATKEVTTIESYVGKGVEIFPIETALKNENARILVLRAKDSELASKAADYMFNRVMELKKKKKFIPYDYDLDFSENNKLSCEEVAYDAFKTMSGGSFIIPEMMSEINLKDQSFLDRIGIKRGDMMVPSDMETDSRFDIILDWTDYRVMRDSWRKDAVLSEVFRWSDDYKYQIKENLKSIAARVVWSTRPIPGLWNMMAKVSGLPVDFTKDVPSKTIATMASLKSIGQVLLDEVTARDNDFYSKNKIYMDLSELKSSLNAFRETHPKKLENVYRD